MHGCSARFRGPTRAGGQGERLRSPSLLVGASSSPPVGLERQAPDTQASGMQTAHTEIRGPRMTPTLTPTPPLTTTGALPKDRPTATPRLFFL